MSSSFPRRAVLRTGAVGAGVLALPALFHADASACPQITAAPPGLTAGILAAWVRVALDRGAEIRLVHLDEAGVPLAEVPELSLSRDLLTRGAEGSNWTQLRRACASANVLALATAARSWGAEERECAIELGRITARRLGRAIGYAVWAELSGTT